MAQLSSDEPDNQHVREWLQCRLALRRGGDAAKERESMTITCEKMIVPYVQQQNKGQTINESGLKADCETAMASLTAAERTGYEDSYIADGTGKNYPADDTNLMMAAVVLPNLGLDLKGYVGSASAVPATRPVATAPTPAPVAAAPQPAARPVVVAAPPASATGRTANNDLIECLKIRSAADCLNLHNPQQPQTGDKNMFVNVLYRPSFAIGSSFLIEGQGGSESPGWGLGFNGGGENDGIKNVVHSVEVEVGYRGPGTFGFIGGGSVLWSPFNKLQGVRLEGAPDSDLSTLREDYGELSFTTNLGAVNGFVGFGVRAARWLDLSLTATVGVGLYSRTADDPSAEIDDGGLGDNETAGKYKNEIDGMFRVGGNLRATFEPGGNFLIILGLDVHAAFPLSDTVNIGEYTKDVNSTVLTVGPHLGLGGRF